MSSGGAGGQTTAEQLRAQLESGEANLGAVLGVNVTSTTQIQIVQQTVERAVQCPKGYCARCPASALHGCRSVALLPADLT